MKILNLHFCSGSYPTATLRDKPIEKEILNSLSITLSPQVKDRGVITYKQVSGLELVVHKALELRQDWKKKSLELASYGFSKLKALIDPNLIPNFNHNIISLVPENSDYPGYILCFKSEHFSIRKILVNLDYADGVVDDGIVITNQTTWVASFGTFGYESSGNLIVIKCQEHIPLSFDCYSIEFSTYINHEEAHCVYSTFNIVPNEKLDNNEYTVNVEKKNVIACDRGFLNNLIIQYQNDIKDVYTVLSDEVNYQVHLDTYRIYKKSNQYSKELTYTSESVI